MKTRGFLLAVAVATMAFCVSCGPQVTAVRLSTEVREKSTGVKVFRNFEAIPWEFEEIALITADNGGATLYDESYLVQQLILKAQELGADGIVLGERSESTVGGMGTMIGSTYHVATSQRTVVRGTAIVRIW